MLRANGKLRNKKFCWNLIWTIFQYGSKKWLLFCKKSLIFGLLKSLTLVEKAMLLIFGS